QVIVGSWPLDMPANAGGSKIADYTDRLIQWQTKALREAKVRSSWFAPNIPYEQACANFTQWLMRASHRDSPGHELHRFADDIAATGAINSLTQATLRMTVPGIPDLYQGTEFWDFSLVDPDNRRPVDFSARSKALGHTDDAATLLRDWRNGHIKQT